MALTPEDVVNKRFQPTKFREGYDQDEVDDFLDEVVVELRRLNQENEELRQRVIAGESRISELQRNSGAPAGLAPVAAPAAAEVVPALAEPSAAPVPATYSAESEQNNTNNLLQLARRLHEEHVREGIEKRDALIAEGHSAAARIVSEAEAEQRAQLSTMEQERTSLEARIDELRTFEREYRSKLKDHIEGLLHDLEAPVSSGGAQSHSAHADHSDTRSEGVESDGADSDNAGSDNTGSDNAESDNAESEGAVSEDSQPDDAPAPVNYEAVPAAQPQSTGFQGFGGN